MRDSGLKTLRSVGTGSKDNEFYKAKVKFPFIYQWYIGKPYRGFTISLEEFKEVILAIKKGGCKCN
jgi:hypothetical protein